MPLVKRKHSVEWKRPSRNNGKYVSMNVLFGVLIVFFMIGAQIVQKRRSSTVVGIQVIVIIHVSRNIGRNI